MSAHIDRAVLLLQQSRLELAEQELRKVLGDEPANGYAHALLALCLIDGQRYAEATREAEEAIHHQPDMPFGHYALARVYEARNYYKQARAAVEEAIRLDPYDPRNFALLGQIELNARNWSKALEAAETGLRIDPEHAGCTNLRAMALVKLGRRDEAGATIDSALNRDPEDAITHANMGWRYLHESNPTKAMEHFREALRLEPGLAWAQQGIVESMKARNFLYRWLLAYFLWMSRLSHKAQWAVILGLYFAIRFVNNVRDDRPELAPYLYPLVVLYTLFAIFTWIGDPLFSLLLRFNRFGRLVLSRQATWAANVMAVGLGGAAVASLACLYARSQHLYARSENWLLLAIYLATMTVPVSITIRFRPGWPRWVLAVYSFGLAVVGGWGLSMAFACGDGALGSWKELFGNLVTIYVIGFIGFPIAANAMGMARVRR